MLNFNFLPSSEVKYRINNLMFSLIKYFDLVTYKIWSSILLTSFSILNNYQYSKMSTNIH